MSSSKRPADEDLNSAGDERLAGGEQGVAAEPDRLGSEAGPGAVGQPDAAPSPAGNMLPLRAGRRWGLERLFVRLVATCGIVGIGVAIGAILISQHVQGWITGLVVSAVSVLLSALLWSSRQL